MNIILSCYANKEKGSIVIEKGGKIEYKEVFKINKKDSTLKEYIFESLIKGLRKVRTYVSHDDLLLVCLQNSHMCEWLNGSKDYKDYSEYLDTVYPILESIDCRYLFSHTDVKKAKLVAKEEIKKETLTGVSSLMNM